MSAHDHLERQLRSSVARNADRRLAVRLRHWPWSRGLSSLILAFSCAAVLGVALFVLVSVHHHQPPTPQPAPSTANHHGPRRPPAPPPSGPIPRNADDAAIAASFNATWKEDRACGPGAAQRATMSQGSPSAAMLSTLPILRRPATSADRLPARLYFHGQLMGPFRSGDVYVRYVHRARVVDGISFYLVPVGHLGRPPISQTAADGCYRLEVAALRAQLPRVPTSKRGVTLRYGEAQFALARWNLANSSVYEGAFLLYELPGGGGGGGGGVSASTIQQTGTLGGGGSSSSEIMMDGIVPPNVATVTLRFPATGHGIHRLPPLSVTGNVVNNVLFIRPIPTLFQRGGWPTSALWRSASGKVIKTVDERPFHP
jgi:hypothetical protein